MRARRRRVPVTPRVLRLASALWETSSLLLVAGGEAVAVDPGVTQAEIEAVRERASAEDARVVAVIATHGDFDHIAGIASFPEAEAVMGPRAAVRIASGAAVRDMAEEGAPLGLAWPGSPRCDRVLRVGRCERVGPFSIETMELEGHTDDGVGLRLREPDVLIVGDYLSPIEYPYVYHSTVAYRSTLAGLAVLLRRDPPALVIPGHGEPLDADGALEIAETDLEYLHALRRAVAASIEAGSDREGAVHAGLRVPGPRSLPADPGESRRNAERQFEELVAC
ncbi:MAG: hydroxyacylglutathione hydrolase [Gaiellales bacterium]|nr:hydroxyacylglutathione hydrolase [Gaiellales bacterium]